MALGGGEEEGGGVRGLEGEGAGAGMWVIDCSPVPDKAECGRGRQLGNRGEERERGVASRQISTTCLSPCFRCQPQKPLSQTVRVQVDDVLQ